MGENVTKAANNTLSMSITINHWLRSVECEIELNEAKLSDLVKDPENRKKLTVLKRKVLIHVQ